MNRILYLVVFFFSSVADAFIDTPIFDPASPIPLGASIRFTVRHGICDGFPASEPGFTTEIAYSDNIVTFTVPGVRARDLALCSIPIRNPDFMLPPLPSGDYVLRFRVQDVLRPDRIYVVDPVPFTVGSAPVIRSEAVPGLNSAGIAFLAFGMFGVAFVGLRKT